MSSVLLSVVWDVSPSLFSIGSFEVRYYGLAWALTFLVGGIIFARAIKDEGWNPKLFDSVFWFGVLSTIIGARLGHCFFYEAAYYLKNPWEVLYIWRGGLASHGAAVGLLVGLWLFSRRNKVPYVWSLDRIMLPVTIGGAMVRLGNLMNSEIYGVETDKAWGFIFTRAGETVAKHPTQLYEAGCYIITFLVLAWLYYKVKAGRKYPGMMFGVGLIGVFLSRFFIEYIKNPQEAFEQDMSLMMGQWLSVPFVLLGIYMIYRSLSRPRIEAKVEAKVAEDRKGAKASKAAAALDNVKSASSTPSAKASSPKKPSGGRKK